MLPDQILQLIDHTVIALIKLETYMQQGIPDYDEEALTYVRVVKVCPIEAVGGKLN